MEQTVISEVRERYAYLKISERIGIGTMPEIRKAIDASIAAGRKKILLDLSSVTSLDSAGLALLISLQKQLNAPDAKLCLVVSNPGILKHLETIGLSKVTEIFRSKSEAEKAFSEALQILDKGFYTLINLPEQFNIEIVKPLREALDKSLELGSSHFVFNFTQNKMISSVGIGILINFQSKLKARGGSVHLFGLSPTVHSLLETTNALRVLPVYSSLDDIDKQLI